MPAQTQTRLSRGVEDEGQNLRVTAAPASSAAALRGIERAPSVDLGGLGAKLVSPPGALQAVLFQCALGNVGGDAEADRQINQLACITDEVESMVSEMRPLLAEEKAFTKAIPTSGPLGDVLGDLKSIQRKLVSFYETALSQWDDLIPAMRDHVAELRGTVDDFIDALSEDPEGAREIITLEEILAEAEARAADTYIPLADRALFELSHLRAQAQERRQIQETLFDAGASAGATAERALEGWEETLDAWKFDIGTDQGGLLGAVGRVLFGEKPLQKFLVVGGLVVGGGIVLSRLMR